HVVKLSVDGTLDRALATVADRLGRSRVRAIPSGWCSWSCYFQHVTGVAALEPPEAAERFALPVEIVQIDDGYESGIGDWLDEKPHFGSLRRVAASIRTAGKIPGIWTAPFLVGQRSRLARGPPAGRGAQAGPRAV